MRWTRIVGAGVALAWIAMQGGCARAPLKEPSGAMRKTERPPELADDLGLADLPAALEADAEALLRAPGGPEMHFGPRTITRAVYAQGLRRAAALARSARSPTEFFTGLRREFSFYEVYGEKEWGDVFLTSYYELAVEGSTRKSGRFTQAVYGAPADLVKLDLAEFDPKFADERKLRGRLAAGNRFVPYFSREEIDSRSALADRRLELCWLDPLDAFFLQVQGSGAIRLPDGHVIHLIYAERNGRKYESIGKFLRAAIAPAEVNLQTIEAYLRAAPAAERQRVLNLNPSYVFFKSGDQSAVTTLGASAVDGRTIATDPRYFPKGAFGFLVATKPKFRDDHELVPSAWEGFSRFVLDQDTGGAITGAGRLDLFWGRGETAKRNAGAMKQRGNLYYLVPNE